MNETVVIILAAGNSSRLGSMKQLLPFNNKTLLQHTIDEAEEAGPAAIVVVTGAHANEVSKNISSEVHLIFNKDWHRGMASGIIAGLHTAMGLGTTLEKIIITVCDQPFISAAIIKQLYNKQIESKQNIIACSYADTTGTPVLFTQKYFNELSGLKGEEGAKKILKAHHADVATIPFPKGSIDIDTPQDYEDLMKQ